MTDPTLTDEELAKIEARAEATTPGPWRWETYHDDVPLEEAPDRLWDDLSLRTVKQYPTEFVGPIPKFVLSFVQEGDEDHFGSNLAFIAHARTAVPRLIAALRASRAEVEELKAKLAWMDEQIDSGEL